VVGEILWAVATIRVVAQNSGVRPGRCRTPRETIAGIFRDSRDRFTRRRAVAKCPPYRHFRTMPADDPTSPTTQRGGGDRPADRAAPIFMIGPRYENDRKTAFFQMLRRPVRRDRRTHRQIDIRRDRQTGETRTIRRRRRRGPKQAEKHLNTPTGRRRRKTTAQDAPRIAPRTTPDI
jgi:hypothetical protein